MGIQFGLLLLASVVCAPGEPSKEEQIKQELEKLQGTWVQESGIAGGKEIAKEVFEQFQITLKDDKWSMGVGKGTPLSETTFQIDPTAKLKTLDVLQVGKRPGKYMLRAIYKLEGDKLTYCFAVEDAPRPTEFKSEPGTKVGISVFRRAKKVE